MNKIGHFSKKGKFLRESLLLIVILSLFLVFVIAPDDDFSYGAPADIPTDPWSQENFADSFLNDPVMGFSQNPTLAWQTLEKDPYMLISSPEFATAAFNNDPAKVVAIINQNPGFLASNPTLLQEFDSRVIGNVYLLNDNPAAKEAWLKTKFSIGMDSSNTKIVGYDGTNIETENANFNPDSLPFGASYTILSDGTLKSTGKFTGTFSGEITYNSETGTLNSDTGFVDSENTEFGCSESGCSIQVGEDGTVKLLQGKGNVNGISAANLRDVSMVNGIINALPNQEGSFIDGTEMFSENGVNYNSKEKTFFGANDLTVKSTSAEKLFQGENIDFWDKNQNVVATLTSGETRFVLGTGKCLPGSCISVNPETSTITTLVDGESIVKIYSDGYANLDFKEIKDGSQVFVEEKGVRMVLVDNKGMHPYQDLNGVGKRISYEIETADGQIAKHINNNGIDEVCVGEECNVCTIMQCLA